jgi:hypothetical protein
VVAVVDGERLSRQMGLEGVKRIRQCRQGKCS